MPNAKCFAECQKSGTRQRPSCCTRQRVLCRVPGSRQKRGTRHRLPRVTAFGHVLLCRVPAVRHSAKIFFFENTLPSVPDTALGKDSIFFLNVFAECPCEGTRQRGNFLKTSKTSLPSALFLALGKDPLCRVLCLSARQFFFVFGLQIFCATLLKYQELLVGI